MSWGTRRSNVSWRAPEARLVRPDLWLLAVVVLAVLLTEVWQSSRMAELSLRLDHHTRALSQAKARLEYVRAERERVTTRAELDRVARQMGLAPIEAAQLVALPSNYLEGGGARDRSHGAPMLAWVGRAARALVPEATAHPRGTD